MASSEQKKNINRATLVLVATIFIAMWVLINSQQFLISAIIYVALPLVSIVLYRQWKFFGRKGKLEGIEGDWIKDSLIGVAAAIGFIVVGFFIPGIAAIGLPNVQSIAGTIGRFAVLIILSPISEELFFREIFHDFFDEKFVNMPFFIAAVITSLAFAGFHFLAYGSSLAAAGGSFLTAGVAGLGFSYLSKYTNSHAANIAAHMTLNLYLAYIVLSVVVA